MMLWVLQQAKSASSLKINRTLSGSPESGQTVWLLQIAVSLEVDANVQRGFSVKRKNGMAACRLT